MGRLGFFPSMTLFACLGTSLHSKANPWMMIDAGLTVAEYFRDVEGQDVLLFVDNIFRFTQVSSWLDVLLSPILQFLYYPIKSTSPSSSATLFYWSATGQFW
jgi:hypothetical protein